MNETKPGWKNIYTIVLVANIIYIIIFYLITKTFAN